MKKVLVIGGYGNFGSYISEKLSEDPNIDLVIGGRSLEKASALSKKLLRAEAVQIDIEKDLDSAFLNIKPDIVIHTSGPFQLRDYDVAEVCIKHGAHYIDLADGREFVASISRLDARAKEKDVSVISGASSVPGLTSAIIDKYIGEFTHLRSLDYGITTAQRTNRGLATTAAILSYTGKGFPTLVKGKKKIIFGWQNLHRRNYPGVGPRFLGNCDIPDLEIFPGRYPDLQDVRFYAGLEIPFLHVMLWALSWLVRWKIISNLERWAGWMLKASYLFDVFGSDVSAFHMLMVGDYEGKQKIIRFELKAASGDGPYIPCMPAILLVKKIASGNNIRAGAFPCVGFITLQEYLDALSSLDIKWRVFHET